MSGPTRYRSRAWLAPLLRALGVAVLFGLATIVVLGEHATTVAVVEVAEVADELEPETAVVTVTPTIAERTARVVDPGALERVHQPPVARPPVPPPRG